MNAAAIGKRTQDLLELQRQQLGRLERARQEVRDSEVSLERIEGALQDCQWWQQQALGQQAAGPAGPHVEVTVEEPDNGEAAAPAAAERN